MVASFIFMILVHGAMSYATLPVSYNYIAIFQDPITTTVNITRARTAYFKLIDFLCRHGFLHLTSQYTYRTYIGLSMEAIQGPMTLREGEKPSNLLFLIFDQAGLD